MSFGPTEASSIVVEPRPTATSGPNRPGRRTARRSRTRTASTAAIEIRPTSGSGGLRGQCRRLGRAQADRACAEARTDGSPTWSPDGDQIVFRRDATGWLVTMNPDGTCEGALTERNVVGAPSWQRVPGGPRVGPKTCRAVSVDASGTARDRSSIVIMGIVRNEGTETLTNVFVTFKAPRHDLGVTSYGSDCSSVPTGILCRFDRLERGQTRAVAALGTARRVGRDQRSRDVALRAAVQVTADGSLVTTDRERTRSGSPLLAARRATRVAAESTARAFPTGSVVAGGLTTSTRGPVRTSSTPVPGMT